MLWEWPIFLDFSSRNNLCWYDEPVDRCLYQCKKGQNRCWTVTVFSQGFISPMNGTEVQKNDLSIVANCCCCISQERKIIFLCESINLFIFYIFNWFRSHYSEWSWEIDQGIPCRSFWYMNIHHSATRAPFDWPKKFPHSHTEIWLLWCFKSFNNDWMLKI